ncbi:MAG: hypothetical protein ACRD88_00650 [Terriglobia bacterium]
MPKAVAGHRAVGGTEVDLERYRRECLVRNPEFQRDADELVAAYPGPTKGHYGSNKNEWIGPPGEKEALACFDAMRAKFEEKYPLMTFDYGFAVRQSAPLVHDPAWNNAWNLAHWEYVARHDGQAPPSDDAIVDRAREIYGKMDAEEKMAVRCTPGHVIFDRAQIFVPIGPSTRREDFRKLWPLIRRQQELCYGPEALRAVRRERKPSERYELRLRVWDDVEIRRKPIKTIAKLLGKTKWTVYRIYYEAVRDIDPARLATLQTPEDMRRHLQVCVKCRAAEKTGRSDGYCPWMQRQLGPRCGRMSNAVSMQRLVEDRQEKKEGVHEPPHEDEL